MTQVRANITTAVNAAKIRREKRNGRNVIIVPSATLPDNVVMNRILYPADVIEAGYKTLDRTHAPLGHPAINGVYINASDPEAINGFGIGAWNENVRRENGRVLLDKVIDVARAESTEEGKRLLEAINKQEPIHTSTGLLLAVNDAEHEDYDRVATEMLADHDCFLLDAPGAATPEQGVGVFVNSSGENVEVVNSYLDSEEFNEDLESMVRHTFEMIESGEKRQKYNSIVSKAVGYMKNLLNGGEDEQGADGLTANQSTGESEMTVTKEAFDALAAKVDSLVANAEKQPSVAEQITEALKPVTEQLQANAEADKAKAAAEKATAVETVVNAKLATQEQAEQWPIEALNAMIANSAKPKGVSGISGGLSANSEKSLSDKYKLPEGA